MVEGVVAWWCSEGGGMRDIKISVGKWGGSDFFFLFSLRGSCDFPSCSHRCQGTRSYTLAGVGGRRRRGSARYPARRGNYSMTEIGGRRCQGPARLPAAQRCKTLVALVGQTEPTHISRVLHTTRRYL